MKSMIALSQQSKTPQDRIGLDSRCSAAFRWLISWRRDVCVVTLLASVLVASGLHAAEVSITTADGKVIQGELVEISKEGVGITGQSEQSILAIDDFSAINFGHDARPPLPMHAQLSGGSMLSLSGITWADDSVELSVARQSPLSVPVRQLRWVRFRIGTPATDPAWLGWLEETRRADRLVVRRNDKALDSVDGTVVEIGRDAVKFEMRGNAIDAPLAKLEGIMFSSSAPEAKTSSIRLTDTSGSEWMAESISMSAGGTGIRVVLASGIEHEIPIDQMREIQFAGGVLSLTEAEVASASFGGESTPPAGVAKVVRLNDWFSPQTDGGVIRVDAPGTITLRIPEGYQKLIVAARRSRDVSEFTALQLDVLLDGEVKWTATLQNRESLGLELPISGARQLTLRASSMSDANDSSARSEAALGGTVEWFSGRLLK